MSKSNIEMLPGIDACATAVFEDAKQRCVDNKAAIAIYMDENGIVQWTHRGNNMELVFMCQAVIHDVLNQAKLKCEHEIGDLR